jgi:hypothetical protein
MVYFLGLRSGDGNSKQGEAKNKYDMLTDPRMKTILWLLARIRMRMGMLKIIESAQTATTHTTATAD